MATRKTKQAVSPDNPVKTETFTKVQLLASNRYKEQRDLLSALLKDGEQYTLEQVNKLIDGFMKGLVNKLIDGFMKGQVK